MISIYVKLSWFSWNLIFPCVNGVCLTTKTAKYYATGTLNCEIKNVCKCVHVKNVYCFTFCGEFSLFALQIENKICEDTFENMLHLFNNVSNVTTPKPMCMKLNGFSKTLLLKLDLRSLWGILNDIEMKLHSASKWSLFYQT